MDIQVKTPQVLMTTVGNRHFKIKNRVTFTIRLDFDDLMVEPNVARPLFITFDVYPEAVIDFRSGGPLVDFFTDQIPDNEIQRAAYIAHDMLYTKCYHGDHFCSKDAADLILYKLLLLGGMSKVKAWLIYKAVQIGGKSAYTDEDKYSPYNKHLFSIRWGTRNADK